jgi:hypothetical protein
MIKLSSIIKKFSFSFLRQYKDTLLPSHYQALSAMKTCRTDQAPLMLASCSDCNKKVYLPHSCGHRSCPHCQNHESQQWLERQLQKQLPCEYFFITFTLPAQFRSLAWLHQRKIYSAMITCSWETLKTFSQNDKQLQGIPGAIAVLHTHNRKLGHHPHVHVVMPAAALDKVSKLWRTKISDSKTSYLFNHKALAKVFRAKMFAAIKAEGLALPKRHPNKWVVNCKSVGTGEKALVYLGRYLYRGVIQEKDIIRCENGTVTYRYQDSKTKNMREITVTGEEFLWLVIQHVLPKRFRRTRNFGFLHPNSKRMIGVIQWLNKFDPTPVIASLKKRPVFRCTSCSGAMEIIERRIIPTRRMLPWQPT